MSTAVNNVIDMADIRSGRGGTQPPQSGQSTGTPRTQSGIEQWAVSEFISTYTNQDGSTGYVSMVDLMDKKKATAISDEIVQKTADIVRTENIFREKGNKLKNNTDITRAQITEVLVSTGDFKRVKTAGQGTVLVQKVREGADLGLYRIQSTGRAGEAPTPEITRIIRNLYHDADTTLINEIIRRVSTDERVESAELNSNYNLIYCNNGIWDYDTQTFTPYDSDDYDSKYGDIVQLFKIATDYNENANSTPILKETDGSTWSIDSQLKAVFDVDFYSDAEKQAFIKGIWQVFQFGARGWSPMGVWFANADGSINGSNGKSTITELLRCLLGEDKVLSCPIEQLGDRFALATLPHCSAIIADETDADVKGIESVSIYKQLITGEPVTIDVKNRNSFSLKYHGLCLQAMNSTPEIKSRGGALWSRLLIFRFEKHFKRGYGEKRYIKDDYCHRKDVLENILLRICHMDKLDQFSDDVIAACERNRTSVREQSSKVWAFMADVLPLLDEWIEMTKTFCNREGLDMSEVNGMIIPTKLLYDCYAEDKTGWCYSNGYSHPMSYKSFCTELAGWAGTNGTWSFVSKDKVIKARKSLTYCNEIELDVPKYAYNETVYYGCPLLREYEPHDWKAHVWADAQGLMKYQLSIPNTYRGGLQYN